MQATMRRHHPVGRAVAVALCASALCASALCASAGCAAAAAAATAATAAAAPTAIDAPHAQLQLTGVIASHGTSFRHYRQTVGGLPVIGREAVLADARGTRADLLVDHTDGHLAAPPPATLDRSRAIRTALHRVGAGRLRAPADASLAILPRGANSIAIWRVLIAAAAPLRSAEVLVDARSGDIVRVRDRLREASGSAQIFDPNPVVRLGARDGLADGGDADSAALTGARTAVTLERISPAGCLAGAWARALLPGGDVCTAGGDYTPVTRSADTFEALMAYFHVDRAQAYLQSLGFTTVLNRQLLVHVNTIPDDNAYFDPVTRDLTFGTGGVDDAEDADVIVHEYGHALQDDQVPGFGDGKQAGALGEGFGDYFAASLSARFALHHGDFDACVADWDALGFVPSALCLRRVDSGLTLAQAQGNPSCDADVHCVGQVWASALWTIRGQIGGTQADRMVVQSHFALTPAASFADAARALLAADRQLYGGAHRAALVAVLAERGIVDPERLDDTPGDASPLAVPATAAGTLNVAAGDTHDVYRLSLPAGRGVVLAATGSGGEFDLRLLAPGALTTADGIVAAAATPGPDERLAYVAAVAGDYYLDVSATSGAGPYTVQTLADADADAIADQADNCPAAANAGQGDRDRDGRGDACDAFAGDPANDVDRDGRGADADNCPTVANRDQADWDADARGDACDPSTRVNLDRLRGARRRLTATGRLLPRTLAASTFHVLVERRTCTTSGRCRYRRVKDVAAKQRDAQGRLVVVVRNQRPGRYRVRAAVRAPGYDSRRSGARRVRVH